MAENKTENAYYIYYFFRNKGWTAQSICGMLGNMEIAKIKGVTRQILIEQSIEQSGKLNIITIQVDT